MKNGMTIEERIIARFDTEIEQVIRVLQRTDLSEDDYYHFSSMLSKLVDAKNNYLNTVDLNKLDRRNGVAKFLDKIDPTEITKVVLIGGIAIFMMKHEEFEVFTGQAASLICRSLRI